MAKDYAKMYESRKGKRSGSRPPAWLLAVGCLVLGAAAVLWIHDKGLSHFKTLALGAGKAIPATPPATRPRPGEVSPAEAETASAVQFDFYNELPAARLLEITQSPVPAIRPESVASQATPVSKGKPAPVSAQYVVQLGVFSDKRAAAQTRLNFLLSGVDSVIVQEKTATGEIIFRIQQGPFSTERAARAAEARLHRKGIESLVRKVVEMGSAIPT